VSNEFDFEEEEFSTQFNGRTVLRILAQAKPHRRSLAGFLVAITLVSGLDSYFTFLSKRIVDEGIVAGDRDALLGIVTIYGSLILVQAIAVFGFIYLAGVLGERICERSSSTTSRTCPSPTLTGHRWAGSWPASHPTRIASPSW
jgi:ATP-binding cassette, subfamily B, bacterial